MNQFVVVSVAKCFAYTEGNRMDDLWSISSILPWNAMEEVFLLTLKLQYKGRGWKEHYFGHVLVPLYSSWICWHIYMESLMRAWWNVQWPLTFKQFTTTRKQKHVGSLKIRNTLILKKTSFITKQNFMHSKTIMKPLCQNVKEKCEICYYM